jgi:hypothetical protein
MGGNVPLLDGPRSPLVLEAKITLQLFWHNKFTYMEQETSRCGIIILHTLDTKKEKSGL